MADFSCANRQTVVRGLLDRPEEEYDVAWRDIETLELYEQLVLGAAQRLATEGRYDDAFEIMRSGECGKVILDWE